MEEPIVVNIKEFTSPEHVARKTAEAIDAFLEENNNCACGKESEYGAHGVRDGQVYSEYFCKKCKNEREK